MIKIKNKNISQFFLNNFEKSQYFEKNDQKNQKIVGRICKRYDISKVIFE